MKQSTQSPAILKISQKTTKVHTPTIHTTLFIPGSLSQLLSKLPSPISQPLQMNHNSSQPPNITPILIYEINRIEENIQSVLRYHNSSQPPNITPILIYEINRIEENIQSVLRYHATIGALESRSIPTRLMSRLTQIETSARTIRNSLTDNNLIQTGLYSGSLENQAHAHNQRRQSGDPNGSLETNGCS